MRGDFVAALVFASCAAVVTKTAIASGSPGDWGPALFLYILAFVDARRVWRALSR